MTNPLYPSADKPAKAKTVDTPPSGPKLIHFHMVAATAIFMKEDEIRQRNVNIMLETDSVNISRSDLNQVNQGIISRVCQENEVTLGDFRDIVILNICRLGIDTRENFYGDSLEEDTEEAPAA